MTTTKIPTEEEVMGWMTSLSNWGRWGPDDELGTLNLITPQKVAQAGSLVRDGISVTCSRLIVPEGAPDVTSIPPLHYMVRTGESAPSNGGGGASDFFGFSFHGLTITHLTRSATSSGMARCTTARTHRTSHRRPEGDRGPHRPCPERSRHAGRDAGHRQAEGQGLA